MYEFTYGQLRTTLQLPPMHQQQLLDLLGISLADDGHVVTYEHALALWVGDLLWESMIVPRERWSYVLHRLSDFLLCTGFDFGKRLETAHQAAGPLPAAFLLSPTCVGVADRRYVIFGAPGTADFLDMETGKIHKHPLPFPVPPLETILYNLSVLFLRRYEQLRQDASTGS